MSEKPVQEELQQELEKVTEPKKVVRRKVKYSQYILVACSISFAILAFLSKNIPYFSIDLLVTHTIQRIQSPEFTLFMQLLSDMGRVVVGGISIGVFATLLFFLKRKKDSLFLIISSVGATVVSVTTKNIIGRPRPPQELLTNFPGIINESSFPSGHVLFFMGLYGFILFLALTQLKDSVLRTVITIFCGLLIALIGVSRIFVGAHWFSDVVGAYLIGTVWLYIVSRLYHRYLIEHPEQP